VAGEVAAGGEAEEIEDGIAHGEKAGDSGEGDGEVLAVRGHEALSLWEAECCIVEAHPWRQNKNVPRMGHRQWDVLITRKLQILQCSRSQKAPGNAY
jgi:hypothetical protein